MFFNEPIIVCRVQPQFCNVFILEIESVVNSIISLILLVPLDQNESIITLLCEKLSKTDKEDKKQSLRLKLYVLTHVFFQTTHATYLSTAFQYIMLMHLHILQFSFGLFAVC